MLLDILASMFQILSLRRSSHSIEFSTRCFECIVRLSREQVLLGFAPVLGHGGEDARIVVTPSGFRDQQTKCAIARACA
jgi:hypothetical protein